MPKWSKKRSENVPQVYSPGEGSDGEHPDSAEMHAEPAKGSRLTRLLRGGSRKHSAVQAETQTCLISSNTGSAQLLLLLLLPGCCSTGREVATVEKEGVRNGGRATMRSAGRVQSPSTRPRLPAVPCLARAS